MAIRDPKYIRDFKGFTRTEITADDLPDLESELYGSNDRASIIMMGTIIESGLDRFVRNRTRPTLNADDRRLLFDYSGPLGTFSSKILLAYAFNFIGPETRHDLDLIRILRNGFAHCKKAFGFTTPEVAAVCAELKSPEWDGSVVSVSYLLTLARTQSSELEQIDDRTNPKSRWMIACHTISERLFRNAGGHIDGEVTDLR